MAHKPTYEELEKRVRELEEESRQWNEAEEALREARDNAQRYLKIAGVMLVVIDSNENVSLINQKGCEILGYRQEEILGRNWFDNFLPERLRDEVTSFFKKLMAGEIEPVEYFENAVLKKSGAERIMAWHNIVLRDEEGNATGTLSSGEDITERKQAEKALRENEKFLQNIFDAIQDGVSILDRELNILRINGWVERMYADEALLEGKKCYAVYQKRDTPCPWCPTIKTLETGATHSAVVPYPSEEKPTGWIDLSAFPLKDNKGNVEGVIEYVKDITRQKQAEDELRRSEERYKFLYNRTPVMLHSIDKEGCLTNVNEYWLETLGYDMAEVIGKKATDFLTEESRIFEEETILPLFFKEGFVKEVPYQMVRKNGEVIDVLLSASSEKDDQNRVSGSLAVIEDITERKKAEEVLNREKEKFRVLVEESPLAVSLIGKDGRYVYLNPKFTEFFGYTMGDIPTGKDWFSKAYPDPEYRRKAISLWIGDLERSQVGESRPREFNVMCKDNTEKAIHFRPVALENGDQLVIYEDVTGKKRLEAQLLQSQKMEAIGTLAGGIAHDFNNSLQGILGYAQIMLLNMPEDAPDAGMLRQIEETALRASELTQQLLTFSRKVESKLCPVDLNREVRNAEKLLRRTIPRMIDIELHLQSKLCIIHADPAQIEMVMMNLGINARDAMHGGGKLTIDAENVVLDEAYCRKNFGAVPGDYVKLSISDSGCGMDKEILEHIFEPFYTTKESGKGSGLGLAMVYGIVKNHGGYITCASEPGKGAVFDIYFPVVKEARVRLAGPQEKAEMSGGTETILLVDDEESILGLAEEILRRNGYTVLAAGNGEKALEIYREKKEDISLVILDLIMPGMGGRKCLDEILETDPSQKVLIASGYSVKGSTKDALALGAKGYLEKPFELRQMLRVVREVLDRK